MSEYENNPTTNEAPCFFWPYTLLALSLVFILVWQIVLAANARSAIKAQATNLNQVSAAALQTKDSLQKIVVDLLELAKYDNDAKTIVDKYQIRQNQPPK